MERKKHKRKTNHVIIVTSDAVDANVKQLRIRPWIFQLIVIVASVFIGIVVGLFIYENKIWEVANEKVSDQQANIDQLELQKNELVSNNEELKSQIEELENKIFFMSDTITQKTESENDLMAQIEKQSTPTEFPLTGSASYDEQTDENYTCVFTATVGITVVATASGTVMAVADDGEYGHSITIDHGNGYVTIYRNAGDSYVKIGDTVVQGTTLYVVGENNTKLGYQMMKDNAYINPMEMLAISG